ncbi:hypothetical protein M2152_000803 [Microbacteriaceae bacterium SG_E_30_P1]|uniref:DUF4352 domain-containing protein n=1 Tax=Antiquaquibacter oligotrophicus TaxID=2880260 RepID=A0ABT6KKU9_9MICO|nr:hypothetical protein [Antiquaquibacter oligotrophicus]
MTWLQRERWYLVALVVVAPLAVLVALSAGWFSYVEREEGRVVRVEREADVQYAGATWSVTGAGVLSSSDEAAEGLGLVDGTSLVFVELRVEPGSAAPDCTLRLIDASDTRHWNPASYADVDLEADEDAETYCSPDAVAPYTLQSWFVVPDDAVDDARLQLSARDSLPELLDFDL